jgi:hypothetical protein
MSKLKMRNTVVEGWSGGSCEPSAAAIMTSIDAAIDVGTHENYDYRESQQPCLHPWCRL